MVVKTGSQIIIDSLLEQGVNEIFGYPGGSIIHFYDELYKNKDKIKHYLTRHEQAAIHAAEGYARATGKVGVAVFTSGPGITNAITGIADAFLDSVPVVIISGQVKSTLLGTDTFQEVNITGITRSITKYNYLVKSAEDISKVIKEAFYIAKEGKPGPVVIAVTSDAQAKQIEYTPKTTNIRIKEKEPRNYVGLAKESIKMLKEAKNPVIYYGGGLIIADAVTELKELVNNNNIPVVSSFMGLGAFPVEDKNFLGLAGMHGNYKANMAIFNADLLVIIGTRLTDRATGNLDKYAKKSKKIHIDIEPAILGLNVPVNLEIVGDAKQILQEINKYNDVKLDLTNWWADIKKWREKNRPRYFSSDVIIKPQYLIERVSALTKDIPHNFITTDVGQHQMWTAQFYEFSRTRQFISSGGLGTMGFGLPAALGVQVAYPKSQVICISGDGSFMMNIQELATAVYYDLPVKVVIVNNGVLGNVKQWQELMYEGRFSETIFEKQTDFTAVAKAFGCESLEISEPSKLDDAIKTMLNSKKAFVLNVKTADEYITPMVPPGKDFSQMLLKEDFKH
ncbi:MAG: biosynthetic-type acetolactate synthase large subunit [Rickettsiales bacterium]|jgi:acetolactate synthase-1/2/3 large subunit|nr:biosynthetic-type acetolactate synthase large subunit [Rickettsiales bacterium]